MAGLPCRYQLTPLTLGGTLSGASSINARGEVVGSSHTSAGAVHAFLYSRGTMRDLGTLGGASSVARAINEHGQVVGNSYTTDNAEHAFLYSGGAMTDLGTLGGWRATPRGINNSGQIAGTLNKENHDYAFLYTAGSWVQFGIAGSTADLARGVNDSGQVCGCSYLGDKGGQHAFLYSAGVTTDLGTLGGNYGEAHAINALGEVVGYAHTAAGQYRAFLYSGGVMRNLGARDGGYSNAYGINNRGDVVGWYYNSSHQGRAFLYTGGVMLDLNDLLDESGAGWTLTIAMGINEAGWICGAGADPQGHNLGCLLTPINHSPIADASATPTPVIAPLQGPATVALDGSRSFDPDGDPLVFSWFLGSEEIATGVVAVVALPAGTANIALVADDGLLQATNFVSVRILTPSQAIESLMTAVSTGVPRSQPLLATLQAALAAVNRGNAGTAANQLQSFQNKVRAQVLPQDPALAETLIRQAQEIIDALSASSPGRRSPA